MIRNQKESEKEIKKLDARRKGRGKHKTGNDENTTLVCVTTAVREGLK